MSRYPLVSIVTLTYRHFDDIDETIMSVLNQSYPNIEYIIADDGSENFPYDEIKAFVDNHKKSNIKNFMILHDEINVGTVKNVNRAYSMAAGEYLMPLSGDDMFYDETVVGKIVKIFQKNKCTAVVGGRVVCDGERNPLYFIPHILDEKWGIRYKTAKQQYFAMIEERFYDIASGSVLYLKKSKWEQLGRFDEGYRLLEDAPFFEKYLWDNKLYIAYGVRAIYYKNTGVSGAKKNPQLIRDAEQYNVVQKKAHIDSFRRWDRRVLAYMDEFVGNTGLMGRLKVYRKYPDVFISRVWYKMKCRIKIRYDKMVIRFCLRHQGGEK